MGQSITSFICTARQDARPVLMGQQSLPTYQWPMPGLELPMESISSMGSPVVLSGQSGVCGGTGASGRRGAPAGRDDQWSRAHPPESCYKEKDPGPLRVARMRRLGRPAPHCDKTVPQTTFLEKLQERAESLTLWLGKSKELRLPVACR